MLMEPKNKKPAVAIAAVLIVGLVLGLAILRSETAKPAGDGHGHAESAAHADDGKHGDKDHHDEAAAPSKAHTAASCSPRTASALS